MIPEINTILYASDLGDGSKPAFLMAAKEAFRHEAKLVFLNVVEPVGRSTETMLESLVDESIVEQMRGQGIANIEKLMAQRLQSFCEEDLAGKLPLPKNPEILIRQGPAAETIIQAAKELNADMIVMGTRTRTHSALGRFFVGSTAQNVMQLSELPVLIVPLRS